MIDLSQFTPIAAVLVVEHERCRKCGFGAYLPTRTVTTLWTSHVGSRRQLLLPDRPPCFESLPKAIHIVESTIERCMNCFMPTSIWETVAAIEPEVPRPTPLLVKGESRAPFQRKLSSLSDLELAEAL